MRLAYPNRTGQGWDGDTSRWRTGMRLWLGMCPRCSGDLFGAAVGADSLYVRCLRCGYDLTSAQVKALNGVGAAHAAP